MGNNIATIIRNARKARGLDQRQTATMLGITTRHYQRIEAGEIDLQMDRLRKIAAILEIPPVDVGLAPANEPVISGIALLDTIWTLFYAGRSDAIGPLLPHLILSLESQPVGQISEPVCKALQVAGVMLRDQKEIKRALELLTRGVEMAEQIGDPNLLATAHMRRSRAHIDLAKKERKGQRTNYTLALQDARKACDVAEQARPAVRGVMLVNLARVLAEIGTHEYEAMQALAEAETIARRNAGNDETGVQLNIISVLHTRAQLVIDYSEKTRQYSHCYQAISDAREALDKIKEGALRWKNDIRVTLVAGYIKVDLIEQAIAVIETIKQNDISPKIIDRLIGIVRNMPESPDRVTMLQLVGTARA